MLDLTLNARYEGVNLHHVRMAFSADMDDVGRFRVSKLWHLARVIAGIMLARIRYSAQVLYFPPAGPNKIPVYRDLAILLSTRWMFRRVIFHFQAAGLSEVYPHLSRPVRFLFRKAYGHPSLGIRVANLTPDDPAFLEAERSVIVHNTAHESRLTVNSVTRNSAPRILFVGMLAESKGLMVLLKACTQLARHRLAFSVDVVGSFTDSVFESGVRRYVIENDLGHVVRWRGVLLDEEKQHMYQVADIFCFPSFYESEALPLVVIEAMQHGLPVVATRWRGIPDIVEDGLSGYLVPIRDSSAIAKHLKQLVLDESLRNRMGRYGQQIFEERLSPARYHAAMQKAFDLVRSSL